LRSGPEKRRRGHGRRRRVGPSVEQFVGRVGLGREMDATPGGPSTSPRVARLSTEATSPVSRSTFTLTSAVYSISAFTPRVSPKPASSTAMGDGFRDQPLAVGDELEGDGHYLIERSQAAAEPDQLRTGLSEADRGDDTVRRCSSRPCSRPSCTTRRIRRPRSGASTSSCSGCARSAEVSGSASARACSSSSIASSRRCSRIHRRTGPAADPYVLHHRS
jgi:hypothetical protein